MTCPSMGQPTLNEPEYPDMPIVPNHYRPAAHGRAAHDTVSAHAATGLYARDGVDWPVSGDATRTGYGTIGCRRHGQVVNIWHGPRVNRRDIRDVRIGDQITTWQGVGIVTRRGSNAGWYEVDGHEVRWEAHEIERIQRNAVAS